LAAVKGVEDKGYEDKLGVVAFSSWAAWPTKSRSPNRGETCVVPAGMTVSPNRPPTWTEDLTAVLFGVHEVKRNLAHKGSKDGEARLSHFDKKPEDDPETRSGLVALAGQTATQQQVEESRDKNASYLASIAWPRKVYSSPMKSCVA
jgi:hypothetical protein